VPSRQRTDAVVEPTYAALVLVLSVEVRDRLVAHCLAALPHEGCGLLVGDARGCVLDAVGVRNAAASALRYEVGPDEHLAVDRAADRDGLEVIGAYHSHTHTDAWPSPTDVAAAVDPAWHWMIVSLRRADPVLRSFRIEDGAIREEHVVLEEDGSARLGPRGNNGHGPTALGD
jgi:[CysO sulfur-carrier protein]-S-L-cysteine hydrolase